MIGLSKNDKFLSYFFIRTKLYFILSPKTIAVTCFVTQQDLHLKRTSGIQKFWNKLQHRELVVH